MDGWMRRMPARKFALLCGALVAGAVLIAGSAVERIFIGHVDASSVLGCAVGGAAGTAIVAAWNRVNA